jgi:hypothetical protein
MLQISLEKRTARGQLRLYKSNAQAEDSPAMSATQHGTSSCSSPSHMREKQPIRASQCRCYQADDGGKTKLLLFASKSKTMSLSTPSTALLLRIFLVQTHEQHVVRHQRETSRGPREPLATWETQEPPERLLYAKPSSFPFNVSAAASAVSAASESPYNKVDPSRTKNRAIRSYGIGVSRSCGVAGRYAGVVQQLNYATIP